MTTLYVGTEYTLTGYTVYGSYGDQIKEITKGPYLRVTPTLRGMTLTYDSAVSVKNGVDVYCNYTLSGTPTETGDIKFYITVEYTSVDGDECVVDAPPNGYSYTVYEPEDDIPVTSVAFADPGYLYINDSVTFTSHVSPSDATNQNVVWSVTEGSSLVTAVQSGKSFTVAAGSTTGRITVECVAADGYGASYSRSVNIYEPYYYHLYFDANGGTGGPSTLEGRGPDTLNKVTFTIPSSSPTRSNYRFLGWSSSSSATSASITAGETYKVSYPSATLYAVWAATTSAATYTYLYFDFNGGSDGPSTMSSTATASTIGFTVPEKTPVKSGKTFFGWDKRDGSTSVLRAGATFGISKGGSETLYAVWSMDVTLDANGGTFADGGTTQVLHYDTDTLGSDGRLTYQPCLTDAEVPKKASDTSLEDGEYKLITYSLEGWYTSASGGTRVYDTDFRPQDCEDLTLYAHWDSAESAVESEGDGANTAPTGRKGFSVLISDNTGDTFYTLLGNVVSDEKTYFYNCISSLSITGGPEGPFEYLTITVPKKRLEYVASELVEANGILAGVTKIELDCMGRGTFTVTKCRYSNRRYTITAYCDAERFRGVTNERDLTGMPWTILMEVLGMRSSYGIAVSYLDTEDLYNPDVTTRCTESVSFAKDTNLWYIMQVCAMLCRCRIWFSDDTVHIRDCTVAVHDRKYSGAEVIDLYPENESEAMYARVVDSVDLGDEGSDTVVNSVTIRCANESGTMASIGPLYSDGTTTKPTDGSVNRFGERTEQLSVPELTWRYDLEDDEVVAADTEKVSELASLFAQNYIGYLSEPQQSIEFTVKEMQETSDGSDYEWLSFFDDPSMASEIVDIPDEVHLTNESVCDQGVLPQKLMLSTRTRHYPNCTTTYTFGMMKSISLSDSTSRIMDALNKG